MHTFAFTKSSLQLIFLFFLGGVLIPGSLAKDYWKEGLKKHNQYRAAHATPLLELDTGLAQIADKCAKYYSKIGAIDHSCPDRKAAKLGENLSWSNGISLSGVEAVKIATERWYNEIENYDFNKHRSKGGGRVVGHFTQVLWKGSKKLGMGFHKDTSGIYIVGVYSPAGNNGNRKENVLPFSPAAAAAAGAAEAEETEGGSGQNSDSYNSSASIPSSLIRGQKGQSATCLALVMSAGLVAGGF